MKKWVAYDGFDNDITWHDTKEEALEQLRINIDSSLDDENEWPEETANCFVAEITHITVMKKCVTTDETGENYFYDAEIKEIENGEAVKDD